MRGAAPGQHADIGGQGERITRVYTARFTARDFLDRTAAWLRRSHPFQAYRHSEMRQRIQGCRFGEDPLEPASPPL